MAAHRQLTAELAGKFARLALAHTTREYPNVLQHILTSADDVRSPRELHPAFFGSFDWHSCVHGYWLLATVLRRFPKLPEAPRIAELFRSQLTEENIEAEAAYFKRPLRGTFERPYGWAWVLMLDAELACHTAEEAGNWRHCLELLTTTVVERYNTFLPKATYPIRVGTHYNSAFAIALALEYAEAAGDSALERMLKEKAVAWYRHDSDCQAWEPGGDDFLSSALIEAECMRRVLDAAAFSKWLARFLPRLEELAPQTLFEPAIVSDRTDGKIAHLDGLNLSRAWCWRSLAGALPPTDPRRAIALAAAEKHLDASLPYVAGEYMGEHWLATFALLALS